MVAEGLDLFLQVSLLLVLPIENVAAKQAPRDAVGKADCLGGGEDHLRDEQLRRLGVVPADLVDAKRDSLVLGRVLALNHQNGHAIDEKDHVLARAVLTVVAIELFGHLEDIVHRLLVVDQDEVQLPRFGLVVEGLRVTKVGEKVAVAGDICMKAA